MQYFFLNSVSGTIADALIFLGLFLVFAGFRFKYQALRLAQNPNTRKTEGVVVRIDKILNRAGKSMEPDKVMVQFTTLDTGESITTRPDNRTRQSYAGEYREGQKVTVLYNPNDPSDCAIETAYSPSLQKYIMLGIGFAMLALGLFLFFK